jgi:uncharacterized membrane protein
MLDPFRVAQPVWVNRRARRPLLFWPLTRPFLVLSLAVLVALVALLELGVLSYAYRRLGLDRPLISVVLLATFLGSVVNLPLVAMRSARLVVAKRTVRFLGVRYVVPAVWVPHRTVVAINVGGALVPAMVSVYLFLHDGLGFRGVLAVALVALVVNLIARPVAGVGIVVPALVPPLAAAAVALVFGGASVPAVAYAAGVLGTLVGADLLNLWRVRDMGAPVVSIGGAGTFDGVLLSGVIAVLIASI